MAATLAARALPLAVACLLLLQGSAMARAPILTGVRYDRDVLSASWTLPPGVEAFSFEASLSRRVDSSGGFDSLDIYKDLSDSPAALATSVRKPEPGRYYAHVGGSDPACAGCPTVEYSQIVTVLVTSGFLKDANRSCTSYTGFIKRAMRRAKRARSRRQLAAALDVIVENLNDLVADLRNNPTPAHGKRRARLRAMLKATKRGIRYYRKASRALRRGADARALSSGRKGDRAIRHAAGHAKRLKLPGCSRLLRRVAV